MNASLHHHLFLPFSSPSQQKTAHCLFSRQLSTVAINEEERQQTQPHYSTACQSATLVQQASNEWNRVYLYYGAVLLCIFNALKSTTNNSDTFDALKSTTNSDTFDFQKVVCTFEYITIKDT